MVARNLESKTVQISTIYWAVLVVERERLRLYIGIKNSKVNLRSRLFSM